MKKEQYKNKREMSQNGSWYLLNVITHLEIYKTDLPGFLDDLIYSLFSLFLTLCIQPFYY